MRGFCRRVVSCVVSAALISAGGSAVVTAPAVAGSPPTGVGPAAPETRPDNASATIAARSLGRPVEVTDATSETLRRWANPDGTFTDELAAAPVRTRVGERWVDIDTTLSVRDGQVRPAATVGDIVLSAGGRGPLASVSEAGRTVGFGWPGRLPAPELHGNTARYVDALPGVDVEVAAMRAGVEQSFVLKTRAAVAGAARLRLPLMGEGLSVRRHGGALALRDARGTDRAWIGAARMWDATGREAAVGVAVVDTAAGRMVELTPDAAFLNDPSAALPITVDPTLQIRRWADAYINSGAASTNYGSNAYLKVGVRGTSQYVTYIEFPLQAYAGKHITDVTQFMGTVDSVTCSARTTTIYNVTTNWAESTVTWNTHPTTDLTSTGVLATATSAAGGPVGSTCEANNWMSFNDTRLTAKYQYWADNATSNFGMSIRASSTDTTAAKDFASGENTSWTPRANITYNNYPSTPTGLTATPGLTNSTTGVVYVRKTLPTFEASACDAEGGSVKIEMEIWNSTKSFIVQSSPSSGATVPSCGKRQWTLTTALSNGLTYYVRARSFDFTDYSTAWTPWVQVTVDTSYPGRPFIAVADYAADTWSPAVTSTTATFTQQTEAIGVYYGLDESDTPHYTTGSTITLTDVGEGPHTLYARALDRAGNMSSSRTYSFYVDDVGITAPEAGEKSEKTFVLSAAAKPTWTSLTWKWRRSETDAWTTLTGLKDGSGNAVAQPLTVTSGVVPSVSWDAATAVGADGPFQVVAEVADGTSTVVSDPRQLELDSTGIDSASVPFGPGSVNLQTGGLTLSSNDVAVSSASSELTVGRTFQSRSPSTDPHGPFGPGWASSLSVASAGSLYTRLTVNGSLVTVGLMDGQSIGFTKKDTVGNFTAEHGSEGLVLTYDLGNDKYTLTDSEGDATGFTKPAGSAAYIPTSVLLAGSASSTTYAYETVTVNGSQVTRATGVMAPAPTGVTGCSLALPSAVVGCRSLKLTYAPNTTSSPVAPATGDYPDRLVKVELTAYDPDLTPTPGMRTVELAHYAYDSTGRLAAAWDPRLPSLKTQYTYNSAGQVATVTPPGQEAWTITYGDLTGETNAGRVRSVSRPSLLSSPTTATSTIVYNVPVSGTGAPWDLSATELDRTGQTDRPVTASAVFPPDTTTSLGSDPNTLPTAWDRAIVHYLDVEGREVNTADPSGAITTTEYDNREYVVRSLTAENRQRALDRGATTDEEAVIAESLSTRNTYSTGYGLIETFGPEHEVMLSTGEVVRARAHTSRWFNETKPSGATATRVTTVRTSAYVAGEGDRESETRTIVTGYGTTPATWDRGLPMSSVVDGDGGLSLTTRMTYLSDGRVESTTLPSGGTSTTTAATRLAHYYTAGTHPTDSACGNKPQWADLPCASAPGGQPASGPSLPTTYTTYDMFGRERVVTEKAGTTTLRTTTTTYDSAGRPSRRSVTASTGTALPTTEVYYDTTSGRPTKSRTLDALNNVTAEITRVYDTLGRITSYTDADGNTSTVTYDIRNRPLVTSDGKGTQTRTYDDSTERRGLLTSLVDSHAGTFTATYDPLGVRTVNWPNGLQVTSTLDEVDAPKSLEYTQTSGCTTCTWLSFTNRDSIHHQTLAQSSTLSAQSFVYDGAGRLSTVVDTVTDDCTKRQYTYDSDSNRTKLESFAPDAAGGCQTATATTVNSTYDAADRLTATGTVYDALGRTTTVPDASSVGSGALTVGYYVNDMVASVSQAGGASRTYTLDVVGQRIRSWAQSGVTRTNHYSGDGDSPAWTQESATAWSRNITGITGGLAGVYDSATAATTLQLTNLHGDVVATASTSTTASGPTATFESTEFGNTRDTAGRRYGWLGGKQRAADSPGGLVLMGVRLYNPETGRFLQPDPVYGGSSNAYDYSDQDPVNKLDLDGRAVRSENGVSPERARWRELVHEFWTYGVDVREKMHDKIYAKDWWGLGGYKYSKKLREALTSLVYLWLKNEVYVLGWNYWIEYDTSEAHEKTDYYYRKHREAHGILAQAVPGVVAWVAMETAVRKLMKKAIKNIRRKYL